MHCDTLHCASSRLIVLIRKAFLSLIALMLSSSTATSEISRRIAAHFYFFQLCVGISINKAILLLILLVTSDYS